MLNLKMKDLIMEDDLKFIKEFSKITIKDCCKSLGLSSSNFWSNRLSEDKVHLIRKLIESKVSALYINETAEVIKKYEQSKTGTL